MHEVVPLLGDVSVEAFGGKAANLSRMLHAGLPIPDGCAVGLAAFDAVGKLTEAAVSEVRTMLVPGKRYAVRSSALAEDAEGASWAGLFETFLDVDPTDVVQKIEQCHNSATARAKAYATDKQANEQFNIAVVVQEMVHPKYAGVLFTRDPVTGANTLVTEYIEGLGDALVSGRADPTRISWVEGEHVESPFDIAALTKLAHKAEEVFGCPQDIEWAWADDKMWLVQARPITVTQTGDRGYYLGEPQELFYWGPSRAQPMYMSDFTVSIGTFFSKMTADPAMPSPPKMIALFVDDKVVWLLNAKAFGEFVKGTFEAYEKRNKIEDDIEGWKQFSQHLATLAGDTFKTTLLKAWECTMFAEFSLYGAASVVLGRLSRFDEKTRQQIWAAFTVPNNITFLTQIDEDLRASKDPKAIAEKYPWIQDGYGGTSSDAENYFTQRLQVLLEESSNTLLPKKDRVKLAEEWGLTEVEVQALTLVRRLTEFMDERKAWMMQTRRLITEPLCDVQHGWVFDDGKTVTIPEAETQELWDRYVHFRASSQALKGVVASTNSRHFVYGEARIVLSPTDVVGDEKIIVVPATSPSYVPLMRKAKAVVTDHGGMMSHAAIVAREFGLPCIVGTKQATKVLKDGDQVVLDLVTGEVSVMG